MRQLTMISVTSYATLMTISLVLFLQMSAYPHGLGARGSETLGWHSKDVSRVISFTPYGAPGTVVEVEEKQCIRGYQFYFDLLDNLVFNVDERVELLIEFDLATSATKFRLDYDKNGGVPAPVFIDLPKQAGDRFHEERILLERARFSGRGDFGTDFRISSHTDDADRPRGEWADTTICNVSLVRSFSTPRPDDYGWLNVTVEDEHGDETPVRIGIYDESERMPLPAMSALEIKDFADQSRHMILPNGTVNWPVGNRYAFYVNGQYRTRLPAGRYRLVVTKGIEYRYVEKSFTVEDDSTLDLRINLERWINMPSKGWISGDIHVHIPRRDNAENHSLWLQAQAEDLRVTNSLEMGNIAATHFAQSFWGRDAHYGEDTRVVVAGQEDPRTAVRGHTIHLNLSNPVRYPDRYLLYHEIFEDVAEQGGISGYAHLNRLGARIGMALDVPFGNVTFIEVLQRGRLGTDVWFEFLNLGYKIAPAAGSDVPYGARIGDVRSYVKAEAQSFPRSWFTGLADGHTFVTNGPILALELNGFNMGDEVLLDRGERINIVARVSLNPDIDQLDRIELIEQGDIISEVVSDTGSDSLTLSHELTADSSTWFIVRAYGKNQKPGDGSVAAVSAPIYVLVDGKKSWKQDRVGALAKKMKAELDQFASLTLESAGHLDEWFETRRPWTNKWSSQHEQMQERIRRARAEYDKLIQQSAVQ